MYSVSRSHILQATIFPCRHIFQKLSSLACLYEYHSREARVLNHTNTFHCAPFNSMPSLNRNLPAFASPLAIPRRHRWRSHALTLHCPSMAAREAPSGPYRVASLDARLPSSATSALRLRLFYPAPQQQHPLPPRRLVPAVRKRLPPAGRNRPRRAAFRSPPGCTLPRTLPLLAPEQTLAGDIRRACCFVSLPARAVLARAGRVHGKLLFPVH